MLPTAVCWSLDVMSDISHTGDDLEYYIGSCAGHRATIGKYDNTGSSQRIKTRQETKHGRRMEKKKDGEPHITTPGILIQWQCIKGGSHLPNSYAAPSRRHDKIPYIGYRLRHTRAPSLHAGLASNLFRIK